MHPDAQSLNARHTTRVALQHVDMKQFVVRDGELIIGGLPLARLAARVGQTPFYAYDRGVLQARVAELRAVLPDSVRLHYAMKANPMPALLASMAELVDGIDVASAGELKLALDTGTVPREISFAGPGKRDAELLQAVAAGVLINVESPRELGPLAAASSALGVPARVAVRVNPDMQLKGAGMKMSGAARPFGVDVDQVPQLLRLVGDMGLAFEGFHLFLGSQNLNADAICDAQRHSYALALRLAQYAPSAVRVLNLGGGFGIPYAPGDRPLNLRPIGDNLADLARRAASELPSAHIVLELGRYLVGEAGIYVCRIVDRKISGGHLFLVVDGGMHHHLAASGNFGQVIRRNYPVALGKTVDSAQDEMVSIVGPLCTPLDIVADKVVLPKAEIGDLVVVFQSGAYGASASPHAFLSHPPAIEVFV